tara:strand:+ start:1820 stop:2029 length:210 start_codon:yes stop_codon:yes gene_type:complete
MRIYIILSCFFLPFILAYLIKKTDISWYVYTTFSIILIVIISYYLGKTDNKNQFSLKRAIFKTRYENKD